MNTDSEIMRVDSELTRESSADEIDVEDLDTALREDAEFLQEAIYGMFTDDAGSLAKRDQRGTILREVSDCREKVNKYSQGVVSEDAVIEQLRRVLGKMMKGEYGPGDWKTSIYMQGRDLTIDNPSISDDIQPSPKQEDFEMQKEISEQKRIRKELEDVLDDPEQVVLPEETEDTSLAKELSEVELGTHESGLKAKFLGAKKTDDNEGVVVYYQTPNKKLHRKRMAFPYRDDPMQYKFVRMCRVNGYKISNYSEHLEKIIVHKKRDEWRIWAPKSEFTDDGELEEESEKEPIRDLDNAYQDLSGWLSENVSRDLFVNVVFSVFVISFLILCLGFYVNNVLIIVTGGSSMFAGIGGLAYILPNRS